MFRARLLRAVLENDHQKTFFMEILPFLLTIKFINLYKKMVINSYLLI